MEQLIEAFGLDLKLIAIQIFNFVVMMAILTYFLYNPLLKVLRERKEHIEQGIKDAAAAKEARAAADTEKQEIVASAHKEAEQVSVRAKEYADQKTADIVAAADEKAATIVKAAEEKGEEIKKKAHKESEAEVAKVAVLAAEKILREQAS